MRPTKIRSLDSAPRFARGECALALRAAALADFPADRAPADPHAPTVVDPALAAVRS